MEFNGISGLGKFQPPKEASISQGLGGLQGPTFTETFLNFIVEKSDKGENSYDIIKTQFGNIASGSIGSTVNFLSNEDVNVAKVIQESQNPFVTGAQSPDVPSFMFKV